MRRSTISNPVLATRLNCDARLGYYALILYQNALWLLYRTFLTTSAIYAHLFVFWILR